MSKYSELSAFRYCRICPHILSHYKFASFFDFRFIVDKSRVVVEQGIIPLKNIESLFAYPCDCILSTTKNCNASWLTDF